MGIGPERVGEAATWAPLPWIVRFAPLFKPGARILDFACGHGRHARFLQQSGYYVVAADRDADALANFEADQRICVDLESGIWPFADATFDGIVVTNYLHRPRWDRLVASLVPGGLLLYQTFTVDQARIGRPVNPDFLLQTGELLQRCAGWNIIAFEEGLQTDPTLAYVQRICARRPGAAEPSNDRL